MLIAMIGTVVFGIVDGVLFAVIISFIYQASRTARPELLQLGRSPLGTWLPLSDERSAAVPGIAAFALNGPLWFGNANWFRMQLIGAIPTNEEKPGQKPDLLVLDARRIDDVDFTGAEALSDVADIAALRDVPFLVVVQEGRALRAFHGGGFAQLLGKTRFFDTIPLAIAAYPLVGADRPPAPGGATDKVDGTQERVDEHPPAQA
jgi:MFS superfamily sulfate permease-like transporter